MLVDMCEFVCGCVYPDLRMEVNTLRNLYQPCKSVKSLRREPVTMESQCTNLIFKNVLFKVLLHYFLKSLFIFFRERGREREGEGEKHQGVVASHMPPCGDLACNPGLRPDWESNQRPFGSQASTQSTEPHQPGLSRDIFITNNQTA